MPPSRICAESPPRFPHVSQSGPYKLNMGKVMLLLHNGREEKEGGGGVLGARGGKIGRG